MRRICIIPCGSRKIWDSDRNAVGPYEAQYAYTGALHRKCQAYARAHYEHWVILSAKHGLLLKHDIVPDNYNVRFGSDHPQLVTISELQRQAAEKKLDQAAEVVMLGGKKFRTILPLIFTSEDLIFNYPLSDCSGIGYMLQRLDNVIENNLEMKPILL
ncbi:hypothetical protein MH117_02775 [Paenibacillus sp. ACRRX]|uniref:DUF6884 domain-containing protein n=1 Tax=Paenibacillus sp. ACRRX TaxID=2918206 RepID=UPI001EF44382|nr:DUF6884 domain-containing protein [Paenibacillus sp. ACRRX]MCG7406326.1 hypothetical protein [Paenibacillus sp. ACRRX]